MLGLARGEARVQFGGLEGRTLSVPAGDVIVLPADTGHCRISPNDDLLVLGAFPVTYDEPKLGEISHELVLRRMATVRRPELDPIYGRGGAAERSSGEGGQGVTGLTRRRTTT